MDLTKYRNVLDPTSVSAYDLVIEAYWFEALETLGKLNRDTEILVEKVAKMDACAHSCRIQCLP